MYFRPRVTSRNLLKSESVQLQLLRVVIGVPKGNNLPFSQRFASSQPCCFRGLKSLFSQTLLSVSRVVILGQLSPQKTIQGLRKSYESLFVRLLSLRNIVAQKINSSNKTSIEARGDFHALVQALHRQP